MQFKNIIASIAAFSIASAVASPLPSANEGFEIVERDVIKVDAAAINSMAHAAATHASGGAKPSEDQIRELFNQITLLGKPAIDVRPWNGWNYWSRYAWNNNGLNAYYYCWNAGSHCYYNQWNPYIQNYLWWGYNNAYSWPVNYGKYWNYYGW